MAEPIYLKIERKEDRDVVATILFRNGYKVEPAKKKNKKTFEYYVKCEQIENCEFKDAQAVDEVPDEG